MGQELSLVRYQMHIMLDGFAGFYTLCIVCCAKLRPNNLAHQCFGPCTADIGGMQLAQTPAPYACSPIQMCMCTQRMH